MKISCIIVAAGKGTRFGSKKQFEKINDRLVLDYSVELLKKFGDVIIVISKEDLRIIGDRYSFAKVVEGGKERMHSVYNGLKSAGKPDLVLIHDAARPIIEETRVKKLIEEAKKYGAAILGIRAYETLKEADGEFVVKTIDRQKIVISQTPQAFEFKRLFEAIKKYIENNILFTDEAAVWENCYGNVKIVEGSKKNIKITTREDMELVKCLLG